MQNKKKSSGERFLPFSGSSAKEAEIKEKTDVLGRKVWDKEYYAQKAAQKALEWDDDDEFANLLKDEVKKPKIFPPAHERKPLQERSFELNLEKDLNKFKVITQHTPKMLQGGYWCDVCECLLKDSQGYLDHINGKKHNRLLGMTMRVEKVGVDAVKNRLKLLKKQKALEKMAQNEQVHDDMSYGYDDIEKRIKDASINEEERKRRRKEKKKKHKKEKEKLCEYEYDKNDEKEDRKRLRRGSKSRSVSNERISYKAKANEKASILINNNTLEKNMKEETGRYAELKKANLDYDDEESRMLAALGLPTKFTGGV